jgi:hypothetical protein
MNSNCSIVAFPTHQLHRLALIALLVTMFLSVTVCAQSLSPEKATMLKADIAMLDGEIKIAEAEDAKYSGGLIKALIGARLEILRQTKAMLDQRAKASTFGIALKYVVDGKPFTPSLSAKSDLTGIESELAGLKAKIAAQETEVARYSGGLVYAMGLSTLATLHQTEAMLEQKRLAIQYELPQFIGNAGNPRAPTTTSSSQSPTVVSSQPPEQKANDDWEIVSVKTRVTESNTTWSKYAWQLTLRNKSNLTQQFEGTIEFQDKDGFIVDTDDCRGLIVPANSEQVFAGFALVRAEVAGNVAKTVAKVHKIGR